MLHLQILMSKISCVDPAAALVVFISLYLTHCWKTAFARDSWNRFYSSSLLQQFDSFIKYMLTANWHTHADLFDQQINEK